MLGKYWVPSRENLVSSYEVNMISGALIQGYNVVIDATNLNSKTMDKWHKIASDLNANLKVKQFIVPIEEALKRDKNRDLQVGEKVIRDFYKKYYPEVKE